MSASPLDLISENIDRAIRISRPPSAALIARPLEPEAPQVVACKGNVDT